MDRVEEYFARITPPVPDDVNRAFWFACHGAQRRAAEHLLNHGADLNWIPGWEKRTPLDTARREGANELVEWLRSKDAKSAEDFD
jgi:hypothetical protein